MNIGCTAAGVMTEEKSSKYGVPGEKASEAEVQKEYV